MARRISGSSRSYRPRRQPSAVVSLAADGGGLSGGGRNAPRPAGLVGGGALLPSRLGTPRRRRSRPCSSPRGRQGGDRVDPVALRMAGSAQGGLGPGARQGDTSARPARQETAARLDRKPALLLHQQRGGAGEIRAADRRGELVRVHRLGRAWWRAVAVACLRGNHAVLLRWNQLAVLRRDQEMALLRRDPGVL